MGCSDLGCRIQINMWRMSLLCPVWKLAYKKFWRIAVPHKCRDSTFRALILTKERGQQLDARMRLYLMWWLTPVFASIGWGITHQLHAVQTPSSKYSWSLVHVHCRKDEAMVMVWMCDISSLQECMGVHARNYTWPGNKYCARCVCNTVCRKCFQIP